MSTYNRLRILVLDTTIEVRDSDGAREKYDSILEPLGAHYCGYQTHSHGGPNPAHLYLLDEPGEDVLALLLALAEKSQAYPFKLYREYKGDENFEFTFDSIVADVARVLQGSMLTRDESSSAELARCWTGVKVLEKIARAT